MADWHSPGVTRIEDVQLLREVQFPEDAGPLRHPVRPRRFVTIDNFYTATVYYKGAEVLRMLEAMYGRSGFVRGVRHYLEKMDGRAATVEDFLACMEEALGVDLSAFARWYDEAGTPRLSARWRHEDGAFVLDLAQERPDGVDEPLVIPVRLSLLDREAGAPVPSVGPDGREAVEHVVVLDAFTASFRFGVASSGGLVPSLLRGFSAPVLLDAPHTPEDLAFLLARDDDPFARFDAGQSLALMALEARYRGGDGEAERVLSGAFARVLAELPEDRALAAELLALPTRNRLAEKVAPFDPLRVDSSWRGLRRDLAGPLAADLCAALDGIEVPGPWRPEIPDMGARALRARLLQWLAAASPEEATARILHLYTRADNLTDRLAALEPAAFEGLEPAEELLEDFRRRFGHEPLLLDKWYALQARREDATAVERVEALSRAPDFLWRNPNRVRALFVTFAQANLRGFHRPDGAGYRLLAGAVARIDRDNPQLAAQLARPLTRFSRLVEPWCTAMRAALEDLALRPGLSKDLAEILARALGRT
ncbi:Aminopeptidase N [bacterium HR39]|nr:Aminopeptidase N [bacterium HR39]